MAKEKSDRPWSVPLVVEDIPESGTHVDLAADKAVRDALAQIAGLRALPELKAAFDVMRHGSGMHVTGQVNASIGQTCVVTLEPMDSEIEETVDLVFLPQAGERADDDAPVKRAKPREEPPEPLIGGVVDLGHVATEFLLLAINPYPRKPDAKFVPPKTDDAGAHPFAALEALKKRSKGDQA